MYCRKMTWQGGKELLPGKTVQDTAVFLSLAFPQPLWKHEDVQQNSNQGTWYTVKLRLLSAGRVDFSELRDFH